MPGRRGPGQPLGSFGRYGDRPHPMGDMLSLLAPTAAEGGDLSGGGHAAKIGGPAAGGGGGGTDPLSESIARMVRTQGTPVAMPPTGGNAFYKPNPLSLTGVATLGDGWTRIGNFDGPVLVVPLATVCAAPLLGYPGEPCPAAFEAVLPLRSRGNGVLYLPTGGVWFVKYQLAATINVAVYDARNPSVMAWWMQSINGVSTPGTWSSIVATGTSQLVLAANPLRTVLGLCVVEQSAFINFGAAAAYTAATSAAGFVLTSSMGPVFFADEILDRRSVNVLRATGTNAVLSYFEGTD